MILIINSIHETINKKHDINCRSHSIQIIIHNISKKTCEVLQPPAGGWPRSSTVVPAEPQVDPRGN